MRCGRLLRGVTTGACAVQGVVSGEARFLLPLRDGVVVEVEGCDVMTTKLRSCPMKLPFPKKELSRGKKGLI
jgi:hypothetical protein